MNTISGRRILIVDDEESIRAVCRRVLAAQGYEVDCAATADEAMSILHAKAVDLVITDLTMPGSIGGAGLLKQIRTRWPQVRTVVMTAFPDLDSAIGVLRGGAADYLVKPFSHDQFRETVARSLAGERRVHEDSADTNATA